MPFPQFNVLLKRRGLTKPVVFALCCLPWIGLALGAAGIGDFSLGANPVEMLLHRCGKWALNLLLITLAVRPLATWARWPALFAYRRMLGLFAFAYAGSHLAIYLVLDQGLYWPAVTEDILERPYITLGVTALALLLPLALTSTRGAMRRLGQRWHQLHRLTYPAVALGCWHFYWQVKQDTTEPLLYALVLAALLGWRYLRWRGARASSRA